MAFLDDYELVADRLARFWTDHPNGRVLTELVESVSSPSVLTFQASVWFDKTDTYPDATGWASETITEKGVNATSALENCETSAIGRALANCNYAPKVAGKVRRPSREEMRKVVPAATEDQRVTAGLFAARIAEATEDELDQLAKDINLARKQGEISPDQFADLAVAGGKRRQEVAA